MNGRITNRPLWIKYRGSIGSEKSAQETLLGVELEVYEATPVFILWVLRRMWLSQLRESFQGAQGPLERIRSPYRGGY